MDDKYWTSITALLWIACFLDPTFKQEITTQRVVTDVFTTKFDPLADLRDCRPSSAALQGADSDAELANYKAMTVPAAVPDPLTFWTLHEDAYPDS